MDTSNSAGEGGTQPKVLTVTDLEALVANKVTEQMNTCYDKFMSKMEELVSSQTKELKRKVPIIPEIIKWKRRGNEEQYKVNKRAIEKLEEAEESLEDVHTQISGGSGNDTLMRAHDAVGEGKSIILHRQKLADSSENGWRFVDEYERNELAENSDDEKKIQKAEYRASRKMTSNRGRKRGGNFTGSGRDSTQRYYRGAHSGIGQSQGNYRGTNRRTGTCYTCGKFGHWRSECQVIKSAQGEGHANSNAFR